MRALRERGLLIVSGCAIPLTLLLALEVAARSGAVNPIFLPPPSAILATFWSIVASGGFAAPLAQTVLFLFVGYGIGCATAIVLGILMGSSRPIFNLLEPLIELLRPLPKPALLPALILFLGLGARMEITIVALGCFFPVLINTLQGVRAVDPTMINTARTFGHGRVAIWRRILLPASAPYILAGMRISLGLGLILVVTAEMISGNGGLGDAILAAQRTFLVKESYAWLVVLALLGLALTWFFSMVERRLAFWSAPPVQ
ncbi:MAG TPA: ABC transporter permease [Stellaceae bacterium]|jgi:ABC-type nitrate/sulfonate/bicarbonate transport system permease component